MLQARLCWKAEASRRVRSFTTNGEVKQEGSQMTPVTLSNVSFSYSTGVLSQGCLGADVILCVDCALVYIDARGVTRRALIKAVGKGALKAKMVRPSFFHCAVASSLSSQPASHQ
jgi:hypothetical protein